MPLLVILILFGAALFTFTSLYKIALAWFVRSRVDQRWERWAKALTTLASLPLAAVNSLFILNLLFLLVQWAVNNKVPIPGLDYSLDFITNYEQLLLLLLAVIFQARLAPQTIAGSKLFAYNLEFNAHKKGPEYQDSSREG